jgi:hypothetical protein
MSSARDIAETMIKRRLKAMDDRVGNPPEHID